MKLISSPISKINPNNLKATMEMVEHAMTLMNARIIAGLFTIVTILRLVRIPKVLSLVNAIKEYDSKLWLEKN